MAPSEAAELRALWSSHAWAPSKVRTGNLFGRVRNSRRCAGARARELLLAAEPNGAAGAAGRRGGAGTSGPSAPRPRRWAPEFSGGELQRAVLAEDGGLASALKQLRARHPVVLQGAWGLLPAAKGLGIERLREHFAGSKHPCHVLKARCKVQKYTYYFKGLADREMPAEAMQAAECNEALNVPFESFLRLARDDPEHSYYLQTSVYAQDSSSSASGATFVGSDTLKADLDAAMRGPLWRELIKALDGPSWFRSQLFVGPVGTLGVAHFDQYDNIFLQVRGTKHVLLFDPRTGARGLCPFPVHHPYDMRGRVDLEAPDFEAFPRAKELRGAGVVAVLRPGDALFVPSHWWHHVEATAGSPWSISINFWLDNVTRHLLQPPPGFGPHLEVELARQVEYLIADGLGASAVPGLLSELLRGAGKGGPGDAMERGSSMAPDKEEEQLGMLNYLLGHLAQIVGPAHVPGFLDDYLPPSRWRGLRSDCF